MPYSPHIKAAYESIHAGGKANGSVVWLEGAGPKAFCAGGDVTAMTKALLHEPPDTSLGQRFFFDEYALDYRIARSNECGVLTVAVWDKIVMGGGVSICQDFILGVV